MARGSNLLAECFDFLQVSHQFVYLHVVCVRHGGLMVSVIGSGSSDPGSSAGWGHCVVFLGKIHSSHSASHHPGVSNFFFTFCSQCNCL